MKLVTVLPKPSAIEYGTVNELTPYQAALQEFFHLDAIDVLCDNHWISLHTLRLVEEWITLWGKAPSPEEIDEGINRITHDFWADRIQQTVKCCSFARMI